MKFTAHTSWSGSTAEGWEHYDRAHSARAEPAKQELTLTTAERVGAEYAGPAVGMQVGSASLGAVIFPGAIGLLVGRYGTDVLDKEPQPANHIFKDIDNIIVTPQLFEQYRLALVDHPFLLIEGALQNQDNVISVKASHVQPLSLTIASAPSHDFH